MAHVSKETLQRLSSREAGQVEVERLARHALACPTCCVLIAGYMAEISDSAKCGGAIKALVELTRLEHERAIEALVARAEWSSFRGLTRRAQKDRVILSRVCHTWAFLEILLRELRSVTSRDESEFLANLASLAVQGMDTKKYPAKLKGDFLGGVWTEIANVRRLGAEWHHASAALSKAEQYLAEGTGTQLARARTLSITASLRADEGDIPAAIPLLEQCIRIHETEGNWHLVARTLMTMAYLWGDIEPDRALACVNRAIPLIPPEDPSLRWLAAAIRTECLIEAGEIGQALTAFQKAESLIPAQTRPNGKPRSTVTAARLLAAQGYVQEAESLFEEVIAGNLEREWYFDAFRDLLYLFALQVRAGKANEVIAVSRRAIAELDSLNLGHDQLRAFWVQLIDAAKSQTLDSQDLRAAHEYLRIHWRRPALQAPDFSRRERPRRPFAQVARLEKDRFVETLLARAVWSRIRALTRREQQDRVAQSHACHTRIFLEVLLGELCSASSRDEAEFLASLSISAVQGMDSTECPAALKNDLLARIWSEVANARRIAAEWHAATTALRKAEHYLAEGTGDLLAKARALSIAASLRTEQGQVSEAVALLEQCRQIYLVRLDWPLVARTLIKMAFALMDIEPERGMALLDEAGPLIPAEDVTLRWLAANLRTGGLIEIGQVAQALMVFQQEESLLEVQNRPSAKLTHTFTAARLLEALGRMKDAERLFEEVIAGYLDREWYKDALLTFLYLFGFHIRAGSAEKAVEVSRRALAQLDLLELGHDQLRAVWTQLKDAAGRQALTRQSLAMARTYLQVHWKHPAPKAPVFTAESIR